MNQQWWVYMVQTHSGKLYTGISTDVDRRFEQHRAMSNKNSIGSVKDNSIKNQSVKNKGAKFFYSDPAISVVYREICTSRSEATKREMQIKKLNREAKCRLASIDY